MGGSAADTTDWKGLQAGITKAAGDQTSNNRLNTSNPFSSQTFNPDGSTSTQFTGGLGQAATGLQGQVAGMAQPMDWSRFGQVGSGDQARDQAINGAYSQATSRLDPQWNQRMDQSRTQLLNQGLDPTSEAYKNQMQDLSMQRNDAYSGAMNGAIAQGTAAGDSAFRNNFMSNQANRANALQERGLPMQEMQQLMGFLGQPGYGQDNTSLAGAMGSAGIAQQAAAAKQRDDEARAAQEAGIAQAGMGVAGAGLGALGTAAAASAAAAGGGAAGATGLLGLLAFF
jgi:hypothetical protein